ncbi:MAG: hypothetical protein LBD79_10100 [Treponema sp.]|jgi:hypothetical protein|nr:hypothetical protein [Treponema sp.]
MATQYSLVLRNRSTRGGHFCIYATPVDSKVQNDLRSLAWITYPANVGVEVDFSWDLNYSFSWSKTGVLSNGVIYRASESLSTDPNDPQLAKAYLDKNEYGYQLISGQPPDKDPAKGGMAIIASDSIPNDDVSIGMGIDGKPILAVMATPRYIFTFFPDIKYWVAFGNFKKGEVLDLNSMSPIQELVFPTNVYALDVTLDDVNQWHVQTLNE